MNITKSNKRLGIAALLLLCSSATSTLAFPATVFDIGVRNEVNIDGLIGYDSSDTLSLNIVTSEKSTGLSGAPFTHQDSDSTALFDDANVFANINYIEMTYSRYKPGMPSIHLTLPADHSCFDALQRAATLPEFKHSRIIYEGKITGNLTNPVGGRLDLSKSTVTCKIESRT